MAEPGMSTHRLTIACKMTFFDNRNYYLKTRLSPEWD